MLIIGILAGGMAIGALAQLLLGQSSTGLDWTLALIAGIIGSTIGGLLTILVTGDGLGLGLNGLIGAGVGAISATALWMRRDSGRDNVAHGGRRR